MTAEPQFAPGAHVVRIAVDRALAVLAEPGRPDLTPHETELRGHITALLADAETVLGQFGPHSLERFQLRHRLDLVRRLLDQPPPAEPLAVYAQLRQIARNCTILLAYLENAR